MHWSKQAMLRVLLGFAILLGLGIVGGGVWHGPQESVHSAEPAVIMESLIPLPPELENMWKVEIGRRFDHAVGVIVHGGDFVAGQWIVGSSLQPWKHISPVQEIVRHFQEMYPDRTIVLVSCNPGHLRLGIPGVWYAKSNVWIIPDRAMAPAMYSQGMARQTLHDIFEEEEPSLPAPVEQNRWASDPDTVGNIFEFVAD